MFGKFASLVSRAKHYAYGIGLLVLGGGILSWAGSFIREQELEQKLILPPAEIDSNDAFAQQLAVFSLGYALFGGRNCHVGCHGCLV